MKNKLNPFEEQLKKAADNYQAPYDANQWNQLEKKLDRKSGFTLSNSMKYALVAVALTMVAMVYFYPTNTAETATVKSDLSENQITANQAGTPELATEEGSISNEEKPVEKSNPAIAENPKPNGADEEITDINTEVKPEVVIEKKSKSTPQLTVEVEEVLPEPEIVASPTQVISLPAITTEKHTVCAGTAVSMHFEDHIDENVTWNLGNGEKASGSAIEYIYLQPGSYEVFAYEEGNESNKTNTLSIVVEPKPDASFTISERLEDGVVPVVTVNVSTEGAKHYSWNFGDGSSSTGETAMHTYQAKGDFEISLHVVNKFGCFWSGYQRYTNEVAYNLLAAGNFSPNGDGTNDYWMPKALSSGYYTFDLQVYDRNNNVVFETSDPNQRWDGKVNGVTANPGEFFAWKATVVEPDNRRFQYGGSIILIY